MYFRQVYGSSSEEAKQKVIDDKILLDNNIAFLYMKMGVSDKAIERIVSCLEFIVEVGNKATENAKNLTIKPDFFTTRSQKIKYKKIKARLNMSLCILHSEKLQ